MPDLMLYEDAVDLCDFYAMTGRTVPRSQWCADVVDDMNEAAMDGAF